MRTADHAKALMGRCPTCHARPGQECRPPWRVSGGAAGCCAADLIGEGWQDWHPARQGNPRAARLRGEVLQPA